MKRFEKLIKKVFCLSPAATVIIAVPSFALVFYMLAKGDNSILSYASYLISAYAMIITITGMNGIKTAFVDGVRNSAVTRKICSIPAGERFISDFKFRSRLSLYTGLVINLMYAAMKLFTGIWYGSAWFIILAGYYISLSVMRFMLIHHVRRSPIGEDVSSEFRRYRVCGIALLFMNEILIGIVVYIVHQNKGFSYPGILIYAMAMYTFYITVTAIINVMKYRKRGSPVLSAAKVINLTAALVSMLSLETAMLARFGGDDDAFRQMMTAVTGGAISAVVMGMAIYMIARSSKQLKKRQLLDKENISREVAQNE